MPSQSEKKGLVPQFRPQPTREYTGGHPMQSEVQAIHNLQAGKSQQPIAVKIASNNDEVEVSDPNVQNKERIQFYHELHNFMSSIGQPIQRLPTLGFKELDLWILYKEVTRRRGVDAVIAKKQWKEVADALRLPPSCTDSGFRLRLHYLKYLEPFERAHFVPPPEMPQIVSEERKKPIPAVTEKRKRGSDGHKIAGSPKVSRKGNEANGEGSSFSSLITNADSPASASQDTSPHNAEDGRKGGGPRLDFSKLEVSALRKYLEHYRLQGSRVNPSKNKLVMMVSNHFSHLPPPMDEAKILVDFMSAWQNRKERPP